MVEMATNGGNFLMRTPTKTALFAALLMVVMNSVGCGGSQTRTSHAHSSALVMTALRRSLARGEVHSGRAPLTGSSRTMVRSLLGTPYVCRASDRTVRGCVFEGDWLYSSTRPQGSSLRIHFDTLGRVAEATWH